MNLVPHPYSVNNPYSFYEEIYFPTTSELLARRVDCTRKDLDDFFEEAMRLPLSEQKAFLDRVCFGKPELRLHLELMITHSKNQPPDDFMDPDKLPDLIRGR